jgi:two-component system, OmpR family, response regulator
MRRRPGGRHWLRSCDRSPTWSSLRFADVMLDEQRHEVFRGETQIELTATEFSLLRYFLLNPQRVLSKGQILQNVWHYDFGGSSNVVETYVSYLRKKLDSLGPPLIRTVRQAGYMLEERR